jgi:hypothetical protein
LLLPRFLFKESVAVPGSKGRVKRLTAQLFHDCGNVVVLEEADRSDAGGSGIEAGLSVG